MTRTIDTSRLLGDTVIPLWLGAGKTAGNLVLGATGEALRGLGSYFEPTEEQLRQQRELYRQSAQFFRLPEGVTFYEPPEPNALTTAGRYLLGLNGQVQDSVEQARDDLLGDRQGVYTKAMEGVGAMLIPFLLGRSGMGIKALAEAASETGDFATQMHSQGKDASTSLKNFLANLALNAGLEALPEGSDLLKMYDGARDWTPLQKIIADFGKEMLEQLAVQEPVQRVIQDASQEQGGFAENMSNELRKLPNKVYEVWTGR
ncbi:MAG: hypothetical protein IJS28_07565 [Synergistaceae bacterium]|nr:hypothetical protein [Synergistaceae bacterium]